MERKKIFIFLLPLFILALSQILFAAEQEQYVNRTYGFKIKGPINWFKHLIAPGTHGTKRGGVTFSKVPQESSFPVLHITIDIIDTSDDGMKDIKNALDFAKFILSEYQEVVKRKGGNIRIVEPPHKIEINGLNGARFIIDKVGSTGKFIRLLDYKFMHGNVAISVQGLDFPGSFEKHLKDFEEAVKTFEFID